MNRDFIDFISASTEDRRDAFLGTARRLGTTLENVEKDFWVCWILDSLFNGLSPGGPRLLFKGGTSLSKAFGLISRFSEDIDITVFRDDLGQPASIEELEALSRKKRRARLDAIKAACEDFISSRLLAELDGIMEAMIREAGISSESARLVSDEEDQDRQSLLFWYPSVIAEGNEYVRRAVKIESGAKSALEPNRPVLIKPFVADELPRLDLGVPNVTTIDPERTFWDKVIILHGQRRWFERRGALRHQGQRISRHYYDIYRLMLAEMGPSAAGNFGLARDCARHAQMFFHSPDLDLQTALPGTLALAPTAGMIEVLRRDYERMAAMIIGPVPTFDSVIAAISELEAKLNSRPPY